MKNGTTKIMWWIVASLWGITMFVSTAMFTDIKDDSKAALRMTTKHESDIYYISSDIVDIKEGIKDIKNMLEKRYTFNLPN